MWSRKWDLTSNFWTATNSGAPVIRMKAATADGVGVAIVAPPKSQVAESLSSVREEWIGGRKKEWRVCEARVKCSRLLLWECAPPFIFNFSFSLGALPLLDACCQTPHPTVFERGRVYLLGVSNRWVEDGWFYTWAVSMIQAQVYNPTQAIQVRVSFYFYSKSIIKLSFILWFNILLIFQVSVFNCKIEEFRWKTLFLAYMSVYLFIDYWSPQLHTQSNNE